MKVTFGGHKRMTIGNQPYEPVQVESSLIIEKEIDDSAKIDVFEALQNKINEMLDKDLEKKVAETLKLQQKTRNKMKSLLQDM